MRIVSLLASATEIVHALGCGDGLVGRSHECDHPPAVARLPICSRPRFPTDGDSRSLDREVKTLVEQGLAIYLVDADRLRALRPDVIITQVQCAVCAVSLADVERAVADWVGGAPRILALNPLALADVYADIRRVGAALGAADRAVELVEAMQARMQRVGEHVAGIAHRPTVAALEWLDPLMAGGNWMPELIALAGGDNLFGEAGQHSSWMTWESLVSADPEVILALPCGWDIHKCREELAALTRRVEWPGLRAVRDGRVYLLDGNQYFNRPGPRLADSVEILGEVLHPTIFSSKYHGIGWQTL